MGRAVGNLAGFVNKHAGKTVVVCATGPTMVNGFGQRPDVQALLQRTNNIGVNRAFDFAPVQYQMSLDRIKIGLLRMDGAKRNLQSLKDLFAVWKKKYNTKGWSFEDFVFYYQDHLEVHEEVLRYIKISSAHKPFVCFVPRSNLGPSPYDAVPFSTTRELAPPGTVPSRGLISFGNSSIPAIHLAGVMGAKCILLLGVDMTPIDPNKRIWEKGSPYYKPNTKRGFTLIANKWKQAVRIINLNPKAPLAELPRAKSFEHSLTLLQNAADEQ